MKKQKQFKKLFQELLDISNTEKKIIIRDLTIHERNFWSEEKSNWILDKPLITITLLERPDCMKFIHEFELGFSCEVIVEY